MWDKTHSHKEGAFTWSVWHKPVAIDSWRARFIKGIDNKCLMCRMDILEIITCSFWDCIIAQRAWDYSIGIINTLKAKLGQKGPWWPLDWQHGIFGKVVPSSMSKFLQLWLSFERHDMVDHLGGKK